MKRFFIIFFFSFVHINEYMFHFYSREKCSCLLSHYSATNTGTITTGLPNAKIQFVHLTFIYTCLAVTKFIYFSLFYTNVNK